MGPWRMNGYKKLRWLSLIATLYGLNFRTFL
uniref:Uncharacterized protein n=1 Tax=Rhizophora mucronata TaxID=61149 RepID=A0A2P2QAK1_RHIMU